MFDLRNNSITLDSFCISVSSYTAKRLFYVYYRSTLTLTNMTIQGTSSSVTINQLLCLYDDLTLYCTNTTFANFTSANPLIPSYYYNSYTLTATMSGCTFRNCRNTNTSSSGGVIYAKNTLRLTSCIFEGCSANTKGGAIYAEISKGSIFSVTECTFKRCTAGGGGAIYLVITGMPTTLKFESIEFYGLENKASSSGSDGNTIFVSTSSHTYVDTSNFTPFITADESINEEAYGQIGFSAKKLLADLFTFSGDYEAFVSYSTTVYVFGNQSRYVPVSISTTYSTNTTNSCGENNSPVFSIDVYYACRSIYYALKSKKRTSGGYKTVNINLIYTSHSTDTSQLSISRADVLIQKDSTDSTYGSSPLTFYITSCSSTPFFDISGVQLTVSGFTIEHKKTSSFSQTVFGLDSSATLVLNGMQFTGNNITLTSTHSLISTSGKLVVQFCSFSGYTLTDQPLIREDKYESSLIHSLTSLVHLVMVVEC